MSNSCAIPGEQRSDLKFADLVDEEHLAVFKYLSLVERVRLERVSRRWRDNLQLLTRTTTERIAVLLLEPDVLENDEVMEEGIVELMTTKCLTRSHDFEFHDVIATRMTPQQFELFCEFLDKILDLSQNLKVLCFVNNAENALPYSDLKRKANRGLEHLRVVDPSVTASELKAVFEQITGFKSPSVFKSKICCSN